MWNQINKVKSRFGNHKNTYGLFQESIIFDSLKINGKSLDGKMRFEFYAVNSLVASMQREKFDNLLNLTKKLIFETFDFDLQLVINDEIKWLDISSEIMPLNFLIEASIKGQDSLRGNNIQYDVKRESEELRTNFIKQTFSASFEDFDTPFTEYYYEIIANYHFKRPGEDRVGEEHTTFTTTMNGQTRSWYREYTK